jgi:hypothetical protein
MLIAAWWCANTPQAATFELILWGKGAAHFSHQEQLRTDVAALLTGGTKLSQSHGRQGLRSAPLPAVPLPKAVAIKKVNLCLAEESTSSGDRMAGESLRALHDRVPERRTSPPWLRPPRLA